MESCRKVCPFILSLDQKISCAKDDKQGQIEDTMAYIDANERLNQKENLVHGIEDEVELPPYIIQKREEYTAHLRELSGVTQEMAEDYDVIIADLDDVKEYAISKCETGPGYKREYAIGSYVLRCGSNLPEIFSKNPNWLRR